MCSMLQVPLLYATSLSRPYLELDISETVELERPLNSINIVDHVHCCIPQSPCVAGQVIDAVMLIHLRTQQVSDSFLG